MKKSPLIIFFVLQAVAAWCQPLDRSIRPKPGPAPVINLGATDSFTLGNGMRVFVVENHKLPTVACNIEFDIKPELEGTMAGFKDMLSELLLGGTITRSRDKLNEEIDDMGVQMTANDMGLSANGLKKYDKKILELMADVAMNAVMKQEDLDRMKEKTLSELETIKNDPDAMVNNVSAVVNFGRKHPYGEVATPETVKNITLARCTKYYQTYFRPNVAYVAIVGDITMKEVRPLVEKYFGKWQKKEVPVSAYEVAGLSGERPTEVDFINNPSAVQSVVNITYPIALKPGAPDIIDAQLTDAVLGGGSQGLLFLDLREKHGWTYGAYSSITPDENGGTFSASVKCRNEVTDSVIDAMLNDMRALQRERMADSSFQNAINYLSGSFAIGLENPSIVAQYAINIVRYHLPEGYYRDYLKNLQRANSGNMQESSGRYLMPDNANIVVAGNMDEVADKLTRFSADGKINFYDFYGNSAAKTGIQPPPAGLTAEQVVRNYIAAIGGENAINAIKDVKTVGASTVRGMAVTITELKKAPGKWEKLVDINQNGQKVNSQKMVCDGIEGFQYYAGKKIPFTGDDLAEVAEQSDICSFLRLGKYGVKLNLNGVEHADSNAYYVVEASYPSGRRSLEYFDSSSGYLVKVVRGLVGNSRTSTYSDYREVPGGGGYKMPYVITEKSRSQAITEQVQTVELNKGISDDEFE